jgi:hypothetical protein
MAARDDLLQAVAEYEALLLRFGELDPDIAHHLHEAIQLRRRLADTIVAIAALGGVVFARTDLEGNFRNELSKMRSAVAYHQASWPIVAVDHDDSEYRESETRTRDACQNFIVWVRMALDPK